MRSLLSLVGFSFTPFIIYGFLFFTTSSASAQNVSTKGILVRGKVVGSDDKQPLPGVNVTVKNHAGAGTLSTSSGAYTIEVPADSSTIVFSYVGFGTVEERVAGRSVINTALDPKITALSELVVVGYGTQQKKDLTGAVASVQEKDFNKGNFTSPDQLIQGRVAGVQITNNSGQPGVASTIKIRGNSVLTGTGQPLFVVDGVPLSGTTARPNTDDGASPLGNPLNFLNPSDIASIDVLKDASAAAIYGSRAAYGVIIITTKKGQAGEPKIDFTASVGQATIRKKVEVLDTAQYRRALLYYNASPDNDKGGNADALASILRVARQQNYNMGISGGNKNGKYRFSFGYYDQEGIISKSEIRKYNAGLSANMKFLESKKLKLDINLISSQYSEKIPPIRNGGSIVGAALVWNPTYNLRNGGDSLNILNYALNPLAFSELTDDNSKVTTILASLAPHYDLTDWLEFKLLASINYSSGVRRTSANQALNPSNPLGNANIYNNENTTSQFTSTLNFHKDIYPDLNVNAVAGFEYMNFTSKGSSIGVSGPYGGFGNYGLDYTNYIQYSNTVNRNVSSFDNPVTELQSYFARTMFNYKSKYLLTATFRSDGSTKFGSNNKYGYFPSFSAAWIINQEEFFNPDFINTLKLRIGWGKTGNQEFPSGSSQAMYSFTASGALGLVNNPNPNLKWQSDQQLNIGLDFAISKNRIFGTVDYFRKTTTDLLYPSYPIQPAPPGSAFTWINLDGKIQNEGVEATVNAVIIEHKKIRWDFGVNTTFIKNSVSGMNAPISTGYLDGNGLTDVTVQTIRNGMPMNAFYTRKYLGLDNNGFSVYQDKGNTFYNVGNPNPTMLLGINSIFQLRKLSLTINMYGAFGQYIYNNTLNSTINVGQITIGQNIALSELKSPAQEHTSNPVAASSRYVERGDYIKMGNATLAYNFGNLGKSFKQARVYLTGQNLFSITRYSGFDAEVNIDKNVNGVPSLGIDQHAYPSARTFIIGFNFSL